ncbi:hypothetical protein KA068_02140 [Candidatus Saccharibacteria bacterium]|jgi:hypothetical protein|nr:hypothetical protein [Candidatus Saccharibacteria bacterium]
MFTKNLKLTMVLALTVMFVSVAKVGAATITVSGTCSLDDAITSSNTNTATGGCVAGSGVDTISLPSATMTISSTPVEFTESVNIVGQGSGATVLDSSHQNGYAFSNRSTQNPNVNLEVSGITFRNFGLINGSSELRVIDISSSGGNLKVSDVRFEDTVASNPVRATSFINSLINIGNLNSVEITDSHVDNTVINLDQGGNRASIVMVSSYDPVTQAFNFGAQTKYI